MELTSLVLEELEKGNICVLPTEVSARFYRMQAAKSLKSRMVFSDQLMAFDEFKSRFLPQKEEQPASKIIRKLFIKDLLEKQGLNRLHYFSTGQYQESFNSTVNYLNKIITDFGYFDSSINSFIEPAMKEDINYIKEEYEKFLKERGLYEPAFEKPSLEYYYKKGYEQQNYSIIFPEGIEELPLFLNKIGPINFVKVINTEKLFKEIGTKLEVFENSYVEIKVTFRRIEKLIRAGVRLEDIVVTVVDLKQEEVYIEEEAKDRGIPLNFIENKMLSDYLPGQFFSGIKDLVEQNYASGIMDKFLLNGNFPYKKLETNRKIIEQGIQGRVTFGKDNWNNVLKDKEKLYFGKLVNLVNNIYNAKTVADLRKLINAFQEEMFLEGAFKQPGLEREADIYSFCINQLNLLDRAMKTAGYDSINNLYSLYYEMLENTAYVEQVQNPGIKVYNYPITLGITAKYHFILGVNEAAIKQKTQYISFLSTEVVEKIKGLENVPILLKKKDFTNIVLLIYSYSGDHIFLSYAKKTFTAASICPSLFQDELNRKEFKNAGEFGLIKDKNFQENMYFSKQQEFKPTALQSEGFNNYWNLNLSKKKIEDYSWIQQIAALKTENGKWLLSPSEVNSFRDCPFKWLCHYGYKAGEDNYNVLDEDYSAIGNFYHAVFEKFFETIKFYNVAKEDEYRKLLNSISLNELKNYEKQVKVPNSTMIHDIANFNKVISTAIDSDFSNQFKDKTFVSIEESKIAESEKWVLKGRIDLVLKDLDGNFQVIDFKKSKSSINEFKLDKLKDGGSVQLLAYSNLIGDNLSFAAYYAIEDKKLKITINNKDDANLAKDILKDILCDMVNSIEIGKLEPSKVPECKYCPYKKVCREKYIIR